MKELNELGTTLGGLVEARNNVKWLLENVEGSVNMKGLVYWAGEVERLREEIKKSL